MDKKNVQNWLVQITLTDRKFWLDNKTNLRKAITKVADKNIRLLPQFREKYPEYKNSSSKVSDKYDKMVVEVMTLDQDKNEKIIKNISKVTTIKDK